MIAQTPDLWDACGQIFEARHWLNFAQFDGFSHARFKADSGRAVSGQTDRCPTSGPQFDGFSHAHFRAGDRWRRHRTDRQMSDLRDACDQELVALGLMPPPESQAPHKNIDYRCPLQSIQHEPRFQCDLPSTWGREETRPLSMQVLLLRVDSEAGKVWCREADRRECVDVLSAAFECRLDTGIQGVADVVEEVLSRTRFEVCFLHRIENKNKYLAHKYLEHKTGTGDARVVYYATTLAGAPETVGTGLRPGTHMSTDVWETLDRAKPEHGSLLKTFIVGTCVTNEHAGGNGTLLQVTHNDQFYPHYLVSVRSVSNRGVAFCIPHTLWDATSSTQTQEDLQEHMEFHVGDKVNVVKSALPTFFCVGAGGVVVRIVKDNRRVHFCVRLHDAKLGKRVEAAAKNFKYPWLDDWTLLRCQWLHLRRCMD